MSQVMVLCADDAQVKCDNCDWEGQGDKLDMMSDFEERVEAGSIIPAGQCPECGALAYIKDKEI